MEHLVVVLFFTYLLRSLDHDEKAQSRAFEFSETVLKECRADSLEERRGCTDARRHSDVSGAVFLSHQCTP